MWLSEALSNLDFLPKNEVGYQSLAQAIRSLVSDSSTVDETMGLLLSLALQDLTLSGIFSALRSASGANIDATIAEFESRLGTIRRPGAIAILWELVPQLTGDNPSMRYAVFKLFEILSQLSHRNQAILSSLGLVKSLFARYSELKGKESSPSKERQVLQKLLRRLLEMGATTAEARTIFQKAVKDDDTLDTDILEVIKYGMRSRWLEHISMESPAALILSDDGVKGMPNTGFTFMVRAFLVHRFGRLPYISDLAMDLGLSGCPTSNILCPCTIARVRHSYYPEGRSIGNPKLRTS